ncbi:hypothetical protein B0H17DRAFT_1141001 [Mycena rosella]|uniref:Uncharacterized protein n=1 Tax=Mycena rosella TaxID=1033263 RepID=A0AAD7GBE2_MYCRO|nr:hypothetical protein B0H17DRAFT_1141001 [Mycena rosella]
MSASSPSIASLVEAVCQLSAIYVNQSTVQKNREDMKELCADTVDIITIVQTEYPPTETQLPSSSRLNLSLPVKRPRGFSAVVKEVLKSGNATERLQMAQQAPGCAVQLYDVPVPQAPQHINNCPCHENIPWKTGFLQQMHQYFNKKAGKQSIFLLHGLGFKNIGTTKGVGDSSHDALQWLKSKPDEWLIFFDNADDPNIDLNNAAQDSTDHSQAIAAEIVKVLCYLPLAIIQAGAFISKSGRLDGYLALYATNKTRLLSQKPAQSHDNYAWTVYTTWQISFDQLSQQARPSYSFGSFLHYQGISEDIFNNAAGYKFGPSSPIKGGLQMPLDFLSQFSDPLYLDPLCFMDVTSEIRAYSLITFHSEQNLFSIHPLVHHWTRSTVSDGGKPLLHGCNSRDVTYWTIRHRYQSNRADMNIVPDFRHEYGKEYFWVTIIQPPLQPCTGWHGHIRSWGKFSEAEELGILVVDKRREVLGENHPDTLESTGDLALVLNKLGRLMEGEVLNAAVLKARRHILARTITDSHAMSNLATTYIQLGRLQEAQALGLEVIERQRKNLGHNHPDTLLSMSNLAVTYSRLGKIQEAEVLAVAVLQKRKCSLGENHPETNAYNEQPGIHILQIGETAGGRRTLAV